MQLPHNMYPQTSVEIRDLCKAHNCTWLPMRDFTAANNSEDMQEAFWREKPFEQFWRWKPLEFARERSHSILVEKSHQTKFLINGDTAQQPSLSSPKSGAVAASKSPPMLWCSSLGTLHVKCPFTSFPFLSFLFPCLGKVRLKTMNNDSMILKLFTSKTFRHGRKGPNIHNKPKYCHCQKTSNPFSNQANIFICSIYFESHSPLWSLWPASVRPTATQISALHEDHKNSIADSSHVCSDKLRFPTPLQVV